MKTFKDYLMLSLKSIAIGVACIIPGVSGGTLAVMLNIYDDIIEAISGIRKHFKQSIQILFPVLIGAAIGAVALVFPLTYGLKYIPLPTLTLFVGLIIGGMPPIVKQIENEKVNWRRILILILSTLLAVLIGVLSVQLNFSYDLSSLDFGKVLLLVVAGFLASCALVVPGISGSMLLLSLGLYVPIVTIALKDFIKFTNFTHNLLILSIFGIGVIAGFIVISKIMSYLLKKQRVPTYYGIIGFIIGSLVSIMYNNQVIADGYYETLSQWWQILLMIITLIVGLTISLLLNKLSKNQKPNVEE